MWLACHSSFVQQLWELGDIDRDPPPLIAREQIAADLRPGSSSK
jgi:hypothetical protein